MRKVLPLFALAASVAVCGLQGVSGETTAADKDVGITDKQILIGTCNALSGPSAFVGKQMNVGFDTYVRSVNDAGGINGRKLVLSSYDDRYEADGAEACFEKVRTAGVFGVTGCFGSALLARYIPKAEHYKIPFVGFYSGPRFVGEPIKHQIFGTRTDFETEERQMVQKLWEDGGFRKFGVLYQNDSYGNQILAGVTQQLAKYKADIAVSGSYTRNSNNLKDAFERIKAAKPEVVMLGAVYSPCVEFVKMASAANWHPLFVMNSGSNVDGFIQTLGKDANGQVFTEIVPPPSRTDLPLIAKFDKALKQYYPNEKPGFTNLRGYVNATLWGEALKRAGKDPTREKFISAIEGIHDWDQGLGADMKLSYAPTNHLGRSKVFFCMTDKGNVVSITDWKNLKK